MVAITRFGVYLDPGVAADRVTLAELKAAVIRLSNFGAPLSTITDKLGLGSEAEAEHLLMTGLREAVYHDADAMRAKQQVVLNDMKRAAYSGTENITTGDKDKSNIMMQVLKHESEIHGLKAPQRVRIGLDQEAFTTTVDEDMRALGVHPQMDVPLDDGDDDWANT